MNYRKLLQIVGLIVFLALGTTQGQEKSQKFYDPILQGAGLIFENSVVLAVKIFFIPVRPFFDYIFQKKVINQFLEFTYLDDDKTQQIFPSFSFTGQRNSYIGASYRHKSFLKKGDHLQVNYRVNVNLVNNFSFSYFKPNFIFSSSGFHTSVNQTFSTLSSIIAAGSNFQVFFADYSTRWVNSFFLQTPRKLVPHFIFGMTHSFLQNPKGSLNTSCDNNFFTNTNTSTQDCFEKKGIGERFFDFNYGFRIEYNSVNNPRIPYRGSFFRVQLKDHITTKNHNHRSWGLIFRQHLFLGKGRYRDIRKEKRSLKKFKVKEAFEYVEFDYLKNQFLNHQTLLFQVKLEGVQEQRGANLPIYALKILSNTTPLRGFSGIHAVGRNLLALSTEYRFPIAYLVEALLFLDVGQVGDRFSSIRLLNFKHSVGFGFRMSRDDFFLFRLEFAFSDLGFPILNLNFSQAY